MTLTRQTANVPSDGVPVWDFDAPSNSYRDTSAAAIVASALLELHTFTNNTAYHDVAVGLLSTLSASPYLSDQALSDAVLTHNGHDCGSDACTVIYSDYYFYEALMRFQTMNLTLPWGQ